VGKGFPFPLQEGSGRGLCPLPRKFFDFSVENGTFWFILGATFAECSNLQESLANAKVNARQHCVVRSH